VAHRGFRSHDLSVSQTIVFILALSATMTRQFAPTDQSLSFIGATEGAGKHQLRVLHLGKYYPPHRGGMETYSEALCKALAAKVWLKVVVAGGQTRKAEIIDSVNVVRLRTLKTLASTPVCAGMVTAIKTFPCDIVHLQWPNPFGIVAYLLSGSASRLVVTYHSDVVRQRLFGQFFNPVLYYALRRAAAIIATSPSYIDSSPVLSRFRKHCRVIPLGINPGSFTKVNQSQVSEIRARFGPRIVMAAGRFVYYKGFEYLISAMKSLDAHLVIVGDGPMRHQLLNQIRAETLGDRVTLVGQVSDIASYYHACDIFVLPSVARSEAFGLVQLEAMACGKPVVNTELDTGVPFVSPHGVTGFTVKPADAGSLRTALRVLFDSDRLRHKFGEAARLRVIREFDSQKVAERTLTLFREVVHQVARR
jgi:rhamnosyl/mannosyltransferase